VGVDVNIRCVEYTPMTGQTLKGFAAFKFLDFGLEIRDVAHHEDHGKQWITMPRKAFQKNGERSFFHYAAFTDKRDREDFQRFALKAIENFLGRREGFKDAAINRG
jgi:hypothetical protein